MVPSTMPQCPHCNATLENLDFQQHFNATEYGYESFPINEGNRDYGDTDNYDYGDCSYSCPECSASISDEEIEIMNAAYENRPPQAQRNTTRERADGEGPYMFNAPQHSRFHSQNNMTVSECPECHHVYNDIASSEMICPRCNHTWNGLPEPVTANV